MGYVGLSVPQVHPEAFLPAYRVLSQSGHEELLASCHGVYRGGLAVHLALSSLAAGLGLEADLSRVAPEAPDYAACYAESAGRFLVSVDPAQAGRLEGLFQGQPLTLIGQVTDGAAVTISRHGRTLLTAPLDAVRTAWERRFGSLV
jgi:phosphoribosylformylglycinamidine (FGAM) synthase-like enzyme